MARAGSESKGLTRAVADWSVATRGVTLGTLLLLLAGLGARAIAQQPSGKHDLSLPPVRWAEAAAGAEEQIVNFDENAPLRYRVRRVDAKGESVRIVLESKQGTVARLVEHNGAALTSQENADERQRLQDILDHPDTFLRHAQRDAGSRTYAVELLHSMPQAMLWSYVPGQPQLPGVAGQSIVLDFRPDPKFKPPSLITEALTGIAGRVWIDADTHCLRRIQGTILHAVNFGWGGVLARIKEGGSVELEQQPAGGRRWLYSHLIEHITIREILVHTSEENAEVTATDVQPLPNPVSFQDAVHLLLSLPVTTR